MKGVTPTIHTTTTSIPTLEIDSFRLPPPISKRKKVDERKKPVKKKPKKKRRIRIPIRPSFTAIVAELRGGLPKQIKGIGISPATIRRLPGKRKKVKKKKNPFSMFE